MTTSLKLGCDCLGEIAYVDAVLHDSRGEPYAIPNAICIHEEDNAVLWKHVDAELGAEVRPPAPARRLLPRHRGQLRVPRLLALLPGRQHRVRGPRQGIMVTTHFAEGRQPPFGTLVDERTTHRSTSTS